MIPGADVSSFQGTPGQWRAGAGAIQWAAVKFTELSAGGPYRNPDAGADWAYLKQQGLGRVAYAFGHPAVLPSATVELLSSMLDPLGLDDGDGICLDLETTDGLSTATVAAWARATTAAMAHAFGRPCILYSDLAFLEAGNVAGCGDCLLWVADISSAAGHPRVPAEWKTWTAHQYSWTPLDRDVANFATLAGFRAAIGKPAPPAPKPQGGTVSFTTDGKQSLHGIAATAGIGVSHVLRLTVLADKVFSPGVASYINGVFAGTVAPTAPMPAGLVLQVPKAS